MPEMIFIFLLALVLFGPRKLPELGRQLGKALAEFKKASNEFKNQLEVEMMNIELEERAKKAPDPGPKILPAEKLFEAATAPPIESIPRGPQPAAADSPPALEPVTPPDGSTDTAQIPTFTTDPPGQNA